MKKFLPIICALAILSIAADTAYRFATQAEVNAGTSKTTMVSPFTLGHWSGGGGGGGFASNAIANLNGIGTNTTLRGGTNFGTFSLTGSGTPSTLASAFGSGHVTLTITPGNSSGTVSLNGNVAAAGSITAQGGFVGDGSALINLTNAHLVIAGANIVVTYSTNGTTGQITQTVALGDPLSIGTAWLTNVVTPTNQMGGTAIDFIKDEATTNLAGNLTLTSVANLTLGAYNRKLIHVINNSGSDRTVTLASGWGVGIADTFVSTNGTRMDLLSIVQPGVFTNVFQKQIATH